MSSVALSQYMLEEDMVASLRRTTLNERGLDELLSMQLCAVQAYMMAQERQNAFLMQYLMILRHLGCS